MTDNAELIIWLYPTSGEPFAVTTTDFGTEEQAIDALDGAFGQGSPLRLHERDDDRGETILVVNPSNIVAARVHSTTAATKTGQYL
ncbi:MAG: hypothetical protein GEU98_23995 [Pseudonocardiaceae bacterium]|nr:hypothetical protein [Pseudonocardiaceae bacterium]